MAYPTPPHKDLKAAKGSQVPFWFVIQDSNTTPDDSTVWQSGGYKRGFENSESFDTIDVTADTDVGTGSYKQSLSGFRESTVTVDFVARGDKQADGTTLTPEAAGQRALWKHIKQPGSETNGEPVFWILFFDPVLMVQVVQCFTATGLSNNYAYDDAVTFSCDLTALSAPIITDIPSD